MLMQAVRVFSVASVLGAPHRLNVRCAPRFRAERAKKGRGVRRAGADLDVIGLEQRTTLVTPVLLEAKDDLLESEHLGSRQDRCYWIRRSRNKPLMLRLWPWQIVLRPAARLRKQVS